MPEMNDSETRTDTPTIAPPPAPPPALPARRSPRRSPLRALVERQWTVLAAVGLSLGVGLVYLWLATPIYRSTSQVYVEHRGPETPGEGQAAAPRTFLYNQAALMGSAPVLAGALDQPGIRDLATFAGMGNPVAYLQKTLRVEVGGKADTLTVTFGSPWPGDAARIVNAVVESYLAHHSKQKRAAADEIRQVLEQEEARSVAALDACMEALSRFRPTRPPDALETEDGRGVLQRAARAQATGAMLDDRIRGLAEGAAAIHVSILEVARADDVPASPHKPSVLGLALVVGLILGSGAALIQERMGRRILSEGTVAAALGMPVLGAVPALDGGAGAGRRLPVRTCGLMALEQPAGRAADVFRAIQATISCGMPSGPAESIVVTSPEASEGKSILVSNLAVAMAQAGQRILVVDADFRQPMQHRILPLVREDRLYAMLKEHVSRVLDRMENLPGGRGRLSASDLLGSRAFDEMLRGLSAKYNGSSAQTAGLSGVLTGQQALDAGIYRTEIEGLDVLPSGPMPPDPASLLSSQAFDRLLEVLAGRYDRILFDAPPALPLTDALILGAMCDATILVVRAGHTGRRRARQARDALLGVGAQMLGVVVNAASGV